MGMRHTTYIVKGIQLDAKFSNIDIYDYSEEYYNSGEYDLDEVVIGKTITSMGCDDGIFELSALDAEVDSDALIELANKIAAENDIDQTFSESDIKIYVVPNYG